MKIYENIEYAQVISLFYIIEFLFYISFLIFKLYFLLDKFFLFTKQGSKLELYIKNSNLNNITSNLEPHKQSLSFLNTFIHFLKSPYGYKLIFKSMLVSTTIMTMKIVLTYKFLKTNFFYIVLFNKKIELVSIFESYFLYFKIFYYISAFICIFLFIYYILKKDINKNKINIDVEENIDEYIIGYENNNKVAIKNNGIYQNLLITGSIGSGKTSSILANITKQLISKNISGLVLDVKGNFINIIKKITKEYSLEDKVIEISLSSNFHYNPINNMKLSSTEIASRLRKVLTLVTDNNLSDSFWLDKAEAYIADFINLIRIYSEIVSFKELHELVINKKYLLNKIKETKEIILSKILSDEILFVVSNSINNLSNEYLNLDEKTLSIIKAEITRITNVFLNDQRIYELFGSISDSLDFLDDKIYVFSINVAENEKIAKIISSYLKLDFQKQIIARKSEKKLRNINDNSVFFICDEYQEFANEQDGKFFSLSREYKCINIVSIQSYTSLITTLKNENIARLIIQSLVNKVWLRNDDMYTVSEIIKQIGKDIKHKKSVSISESSQNSKYNFFYNKFNSLKSGLTQNYSLTENYEYVLNENYFTYSLKSFEACALLSDGNESKLYKKVNLKIMEEIVYEKK